MSDKKGGDDDGALMLFLIAAFIALLCWVIWFVFKFQLIQFVLWVRYAELSLIGLVFGVDHEIAVPGIPQPMNIAEWKEFVINADPRNIEFRHISVPTYMTMSILKYVFAFIMAIFTFWAIFRGPTSMFRRNLGLDGLIQEQSKTFKTISPFVNFDPNKLTFRSPGDPVPAELPLFSEALSSEEWVAYNRIPMPDGQLDTVAAEKAFVRQLMGPWKGALKQKDYVQIILAAFCLKTARKRNEADLMLGRLAECWSHDKGLQLSKDRKLLREAKSVLKNKKMSEKLHSTINKHAFIATAVLRGLDLARSEGGVLAPAQLVWMRGHDRNLWYALNNLGKQAFHMEALGALSHYRAEKQVQRPIPKPKVQPAVDALKAYLGNSLVARPIPELDYSMVKDSKKNKGVLKPV